MYPYKTPIFIFIFINFYIVLSTQRYKRDNESERNSIVVAEGIAVTGGLLALPVAAVKVADDSINCSKTEYGTITTNCLFYRQGFENCSESTSSPEQQQVL